MLGTKVHGGFGAFIPVGIKIGLDSLARLKAQPRDVTVNYFDSDQSPCACFVDGIMIATAASPGQRTLTIDREPAPAGFVAVALIKHKMTGKSVKYSISTRALEELSGWNRSLDPAGRFDAVMATDGLFEVEALD